MRSNEKAVTASGFGVRHARFVLLTSILPAMLALLLSAEPSAAREAEGSSAPASASATIGKQLFRSYCSSCHGIEGRGDGTLAEVLTVKPTDLALLAAENEGVFPEERTRKVIDGREKVKGHGGGEMPVWGDAFSQIDSSEEAIHTKIGQLVAFLESIQE